MDTSDTTIAIAGMVIQIILLSNYKTELDIHPSVCDKMHGLINLFQNQEIYYFH